MNAVNLLKTQHQKVADLFTRYEPQRYQNRARPDQVCERTAEKPVTPAKAAPLCYPPANSELTSLLRRAVAEHQYAKRLLADYMQAAPREGGYEAKVKGLMAEMAQNLKGGMVEEKGEGDGDGESEECAAVRQLAAEEKEAEDALYAQMDKMFQRLLKKEPCRVALNDTDMTAARELAANL